MSNVYAMQFKHPKLEYFNYPQLKQNLTKLRNQFKFVINMRFHHKHAQCNTILKTKNMLEIVQIFKHPVHLDAGAEFDVVHRPVL